MAEKKRKRHDDGAERPSKKPAVASAPGGTVRVEFVDNKNGLGPILGMASEGLHI
jgi:DNA-directed RNA polymerase I subunit RPA49